MNLVNVSFKDGTLGQYPVTEPSKDLSVTAQTITLTSVSGALNIILRENVKELSVVKVEVNEDTSTEGERSSAPAVDSGPDTTED